MLSAGSPPCPDSLFHPPSPVLPFSRPAWALLVFLHLPGKLLLSSLPQNLWLPPYDSRSVLAVWKELRGPDSGFALFSFQTGRAGGRAACFSSCLFPLFLPSRGEVCLENEL